MNLSMFISRRRRSRWRMPGRWWFRGVGQQPTKGDWTRNQKRAGNRAKTSLRSCKNFPALLQKFPAPRNKIPRSWTGSGGRTTGSVDLRGGPAPRRHPVGAAPVTPAGGCENSWSKPYSVLCLFLRARPMRERHEQQTSSRPIALGNGPGCSAQPRLALRAAPFADCSPLRRGCEQEPALAPTP